MTTFNPRIVIISLGNPAALFQTYHSAGHHALEALRTCIHPAPPPFRRAAHGAEPCHSSETPKYTLIQSPTFMNVSGGFVARVWKEIATQCAREGRHAGMIVMHDDLELPFGTPEMRSWEAGTRGHNGLRSINGMLTYAQWKNKGVFWRRIGVGIGRPDSREKGGDVKDFVLSKMGKRELDTLARAGGQIQSLVEKFEKEWEMDLRRATGGGGGGNAAATSSSTDARRRHEEPSRRREPRRGSNEDSHWWRS